MLCLWFPQLASERSLRIRPVEGPFALTARAGNAEHLHCLNPAAAALGLARGMALADARAICPGLVTRPADLPAETAFLTALIRWAGRYSPLVGRDGAEGLVADIAGVAHLFGGEAALIADARARLARAGVTVRAGLADTRGAAHALARAATAGDSGIAPPGTTAAALRDLPLGLLRIDHDTVTALARLGLRTVGELMAQPRAPLTRRFGPAPFLRLDQALGAVPEPLAADPLPPHYGIRLSLPEPIGRVQDVAAGLDRLLGPLCARLAAAQAGARRLRFELRRTDGSQAVVEIGLARPMRDPARIAPLFARGIEGVEAGFGIDRLRLQATVVEPLAPQQLGAPRAAAEDALADLITRLGNRLGFDRIRRFHPADSHIPERSFQTLPVAYSDPAGPWPAGPDRPLLIFPPEPVFDAGPAGSRPPARFRWRRVRFDTARATGPERLAPEWWFDDPAWRQGLRDYWKVETRQGRRLWLFFTPQAPAWQVQGEFA